MVLEERMVEGWLVGDMHAVDDVYLGSVE